MNVTNDLILVPYFIYSNGTMVDETKALEPYGYRTLVDIIRSCLLTVFACTWSTLHPNVPALFWYKVKLWIVTLMMPELLLLWAAKQFFAAQHLAKENSIFRVVRRLCVKVIGFSGKKTDEETPSLRNSDWTRTQAFFALMGGLRDKNNIVSPYDTFDRIQLPTNAEILDKSKKDLLVDVLAIFQTLWFAIVTIYRIQSPVLYATEPEIVTFTFACLSTITHLFWLSKPKGVREPLSISPGPTSSQPTLAFTDDLKDDTPPLSPPIYPNPTSSENFLAFMFKLATSILHWSERTEHDESIRRSIPHSDIYAYDGELSWGEMIMAVLFASIFGSLAGVCHLTVSSLDSGMSSRRGLIWFSVAFIGSALSFYLLLVAFISFVTVGRERRIKFLRRALSKRLTTAFLITSVIGRMTLFGVICYFTFTPYAFNAFLTPKWSDFIPHPF